MNVAAPGTSSWRRRWFGRAFRITRNLLALFGLVVAIRQLCFDVSIVVSPSMSPTLRGDVEHGVPGDWIISEKVSYWFRRPRRWEIVRFQSSDGLWILKRVAGLPGESVSLFNNWLSINGVPMPRPGSLSFLTYYPYGKCRGGASVPCGNGYFLLGDHSKDSQDSRYEGPLEPGRIVGRGVDSCLAVVALRVDQSVGDSDAVPRLG